MRYLTVYYQLAFHQIRHGGRPIQQPWRVPAGSTITDLTFRVLDESGSEIEPDPLWFKAKGSGLRVDWVGDKENRKLKGTSKSLPDIKVRLMLYMPLTQYTFSNIFYRLLPLL
jgi:hypothetical protein